VAQRQIRAGRYWLGGKRKAEQDHFFKQALDTAYWRPGSAEHWDACWYTGMPEVGQFLKAGPDRKINHIPGNNALTLKNRLYEVLTALRDRLEEQYGPDHEHVARLHFLPRVYSIPEDYHALQQAALDAPGRHWILKPKNASRGRGVRVVRDVTAVPLEDRWMVQEYLGTPHTMKQRKYVLRLYVLISSITPLRVYLYQQGFAKLASAPYDINDIDNPFSQLTNPDINALNTEADIPVEFVDLDRYRQWLREEGHDDGALFEKVRDLVTLTAIAAVEPMRERTRKLGVDSRGCYELLGVDCLIDEDLKPWLLECNLSPSLGVCAAPASGGTVEAQIKSDMVTDMASLVGLLGVEQTSAPAPAPDDPVARIHQEAENELGRAGGFQRLFPGASVEDYLPFFSLPRLQDMVLADDVNAAPVRRPGLQRRFAAELISGDELLLYDERIGQLVRLNETAAFIWLLASAGADPDNIAQQLLDVVTRSGEPTPGIEELRREVWDLLADWAHAGLLMQKGPGPRRERTPTPPLRRTPRQSFLRCGTLDLTFHTDSEPVLAHLGGLLSSWKAPDGGDPTSPRLEVVRSTRGYAIISDGEVIGSSLTLAALEPVLSRYLTRQAATPDEVVLDVSWVPANDAVPLVFAGRRPGFGEAFARHFACYSGSELRTGLRLNPTTSRGHIILLPVLEDESRASLLQPLSVNDALDQLLPACSLGDGSPLDADKAGAFVEWLQVRSCYTLNVVDYPSACEVLTRILSDPQDNAHAGVEMVSAL